MLRRDERHGRRHEAQQSELEAGRESGRGREDDPHHDPRDRQSHCRDAGRRPLCRPGHQGALRRHSGGAQSYGRGRGRENPHQNRLPALRQKEQRRNALLRLVRRTAHRGIIRQQSAEKPHFADVGAFL